VPHRQTPLAIFASAPCTCAKRTTITSVPTSVPGSASGWGYQIDLGYKFAIRRISFAPQISYKDYEDKISDSSTVTQTYIDPYFVIWIDF
jgi:hypothetical protein